MFSIIYFVSYNTLVALEWMDQYTEAVEYLTEKDDKTVKSLRSRMNGGRRIRERDSAPL